MTSPPQPPAATDTITALAAQITSLRGQVRAISARIDHVGLTGDLNLADQFTELARTVTQAFDAPPHGPAAPYWISLDPAEHAAQLTGTMRRINDITRKCHPDCATRQRTPKTAHRPASWRPADTSPGKDPDDDRQRTGRPGGRG